MDLGYVRGGTLAQREAMLQRLFQSFQRTPSTGEIRQWHTPEGQLRDLARHAASWEWLQELIGMDVTARVEVSVSGRGVAIILEPAETLAPALRFVRRTRRAGRESPSWISREEATGGGG